MERQNVDYLIDQANPELEAFAGPKAFVTGTIEEFVERVEAAIQDEGFR